MLIIEDVVRTTIGMKTNPEMMTLVVNVNMIFCTYPINIKHDKVAISKPIALF